MKTVWVSETRHWWNNWIGVSLWSPWVRWVHLICFYSADHFTFCCGWEKLLIPALLPQCEAGQSEKTAGHQSTAEHTHTCPRPCHLCMTFYAHSTQYQGRPFVLSDRGEVHSSSGVIVSAWGQDILHTALNAQTRYRWLKNTFWRWAGVEHCKNAQDSRPFRNLCYC